MFADSDHVIANVEGAVLSDGNVLAEFGVLCIDGLGPTGDECHAPGEYLEIDSVIPYYNLSMLLIKDLADRKNV